MSPFAQNSHHKRPLPPTPVKCPITDVEDESGLKPPISKRINSGRILDYEKIGNQDGLHITLDQKLMEIKFPQRVPNSPYSIK